MTRERVRIRPTKKLVALGFGALALFAVGTNVQAGWVLAIAALLVGALLIGAVMPVRALRGVDVARRTPPVAVAGRPVRISLDVTNTSGGARGLLRLTDEFCGPGAAVVGFLRPGSTRAFAADRSGARRGVYSSGPCLVETGAPFGIVSVRARAQLASPIVVHPATYDVPAGVMHRIVARSAPAADGEVSSVREYRHGDPLRRIHWRSSARRGQLVVHELEVERHADLSVCVDMPSDPDTGDAVASVACSLALAAVRDGGEVALVAAAGGSGGQMSEAERPPDQTDGIDSRRVRTVDGVLDWGARLEPGAAGLPQLVERAQGTGATVCVCTPPGSATMATLSDLVRRSPLFVVMVRPRAERVPDGSEDRLRAAGATVATVWADEVATWFESGCPAS